MVANSYWFRPYICSLALVAFLCSLPLTASAHPMGNFSINHFSAIEVYPTFIRLSYVIDMAEIPTFQEMQEFGFSARPDEPSTVTYRERKVRELQQGLSLRIGEQELPLSPGSSTLTFPTGAGGLPTLRLSTVYDTPLEVANGQLVYEDHNYPQRAGWKEIVATAHGGASLITSSAPPMSRSNQLMNYTADLIQAPPQDLRANLTFSVPASARTFSPSPSSVSNALIPPPGREAGTPRSRLTELITTRQLSPGIVVFALLMAIGLGAFHALEPGHGKTLVAAYLVGSRGTAWHALLLGLTVTASHTIGVFALGAVALFASHYIVPERLYPWLGFISGILIASMGIVLLKQAWLRSHGYSLVRHHPHAHQPNRSHGRGYSHGHLPDHGRSHHRHQHDSDHGDHAHGHPKLGEVSYGTLLTLGITGGMIPCPGALVVLLSAVALQRIAFGLLLIVAFSIGLATVLVSAGVLLVSARGILQRWNTDGPWSAYLPFLSPLVITPLGVLLAVQSLFGAGILPSFLF